MTGQPKHTGRFSCTRRSALQWLSGLFVLNGNIDGSWAAEWPTRWQVNSVRFHADFPLRPEAPFVKETLDLRRSVPDALSLDANDEPINVYVFSNRKIYEAYVKHYFPGVPSRRALFIKQHASGMVFVYYSQQIAVDLRHEATHAVLHTMLPMVPLWLDEGLAEYFEVNSAHRAYNNPHMKQTRRNARWRRPTPLSKLESIRQLDQMQRDEYRDAWSWIHYLLHGPKAANQEFLGYLADIRRHTPPGQLSRRLDARIPDLSRSYANHFLEFRV